MKFIYQYDENSPKVEVTLPPDSTLSVVLENFEGFLRAAGYHFEGMVDILMTENELEIHDADGSDNTTSTLN